MRDDKLLEEDEDDEVDEVDDVETAEVRESNGTVAVGKS